MKVSRWIGEQVAAPRLLYKRPDTGQGVRCRDQETGETTVEGDEEKAENRLDAQSRHGLDCQAIIITIHTVFLLSTHTIRQC